jgi:hypothetical protein
LSRMASLAWSITWSDRLNTSTTSTDSRTSSSDAYTFSPSISFSDGWIGIIRYPFPFRYAETAWESFSGFGLNPTTAMVLAFFNISRISCASWLFYPISSNLLSWLSILEGFVKKTTLCIERHRLPSQQPLSLRKWSPTLNLKLFNNMFLEGFS